MFGGKSDGESLVANAGFAVAEKAAPNKSICPSLSLKTRVYGWLTCLVLGSLVSFASSGMVFQLAKNPIKFAVLYTLGTTIALCSSLFLWGPKSQCESMFHAKRRISISIVLICIVGVITCACLNGYASDRGFNKMWAIILVLVCAQSCAYFWFCLSFVPYGRTIFCKCCKRCINEAE